MLGVQLAMQCDMFGRASQGSNKTPGRRCPAWCSSFTASRQAEDTAKVLVRCARPDAFVMGLLLGRYTFVWNPPSCPPSVLNRGASCPAYLQWASPN